MLYCWENQLRTFDHIADGYTPRWIKQEMIEREVLKDFPAPLTDDEVTSLLTEPGI